MRLILTVSMEREREKGTKSCFHRLSGTGKARDLRGSKREERKDEGTVELIKRKMSGKRRNAIINHIAIMAAIME